MKTEASSRAPSERPLPDPAELARHYSRFGVADRLLLTGHSHQAWPDVAREGQLRAFQDAAERVDLKWERAERVAGRVRDGWRGLLDDDPGDGHVVLGQSTHDLLVRFLSALPLAERPRVVTTDGEFHTVRRQLDRLWEGGWIEVERLPARPVEGLAERLAAAVDDRTAAVLVSSVLYETAEIVPGVGRTMKACLERGAELLVDSYHHLGVVPFRIGEMGLREAFVTGGGYKYCQLGEGNCFLRFPAHRTELRPAVTGWFSEFAELGDPPTPGAVPYGSGHARFAGATYDPTAHYRAAAVFDFFRDRGLTPELLRRISQHQVALLADAVREAAGDRARPVALERVGLEGTGGFLALEVSDAAGARAALLERGVLTDHRGDLLRLGPAPYLTDDQLRRAARLVGEVV